MRAYIKHFAVPQNYDFIEIFDCGNAVRNINRSLAFSVRSQAFKNILFRLCINGGKRIVQNEYRSVFHKSARNRSPLLLPARNCDASLSEHRVIAVLKRHHIAIYICEPSNAYDVVSFHLLIAKRKRYVACYSVRKQKVVLRHICNTAS